MSQFSEWYYARRASMNAIWMPTVATAPVWAIDSEAALGVSIVAAVVGGMGGLITWPMSGYRRDQENRLYDSAGVVRKPNSLTITAEGNEVVVTSKSRPGGRNWLFPFFGQLPKSHFVRTIERRFDADTEVEDAHVYVASIKSAQENPQLETATTEAQVLATVLQGKKLKRKQLNR